ncbi:MAG: multicopper polyphenol oxidase [Propionibacterium sp. 4572_24]|nr:MAG: multicopper polyphenol oxidase [Propionibacterium sp. 4572_24]
MLRFVIDPGANHGVGVAFTDRVDASGQGRGGAGFEGFNLGRADEDPTVLEHVESLRSRLPQRYLGNRVEGQPKLPIADAMVTDLPGVALAIRVADCMPIMLADPKAGVVGAAHAGRVGFLAGVLPATVKIMCDMGATELLAWLGPHICGRCYEVPAEMAEQVWAKYPATRAVTRQGAPALDLGAGALAQLESLGVAAVGLDPCTFEGDDFFSHRRDHGAGRLAGLVWNAHDAH